MKKEKKQKIKNKYYLQFLQAGIIVTLKEDHIRKALDNASKHKYRGLKNPHEARALILALYYTGARPNEVLQIKGKDCEIEGKYLKIKLNASKGGLPRTAFLPIKKELVKELANYSMSFFDEMYLFYHFFSTYIRKWTNKRGEIKTYLERTDAVRNWFRVWFDGVLEEAIPPYFLRHNRFSQLVEAGISLEDVRMLKGSRSFESIVPYIHMSSKAAKNIARKIE